MASDSRLTLNTEQRKEEKQVVQIAVGQSDSNYKTFLTPNNIGISTYGTAEIKGVPIAGYIESFMIEHLSTKKNVDQVPRLLLGYFQQFHPPPSTQFHVAGYKEEYSQQHQHVWHVDVANNKISQLNPPGKPGASWGGEADILARLIQPVAIVDNQNEAGQPLPYFPIPWQFFTLQDAIDFCIFAVRSTIDAIRFQPRPKTVGGPIDVLVIKPDKAFWVQRKELHG
jgi:hypothetical protein